MKRITLMVITIVALAFGAVAQPQRRGPQGGPPPPGPPPALAEYLQLTEAQKATVDTAHKEFEASVKAAHDAMDQKIEAVLTPEQKTKFEAFRAATRFMHEHP